MGKFSKSSPVKDRLKELEEFVSQQSGKIVRRSGKASVKNKGGATVSTRKDRRFAERRMVKMRKNAFKQGKELPTLESVELEKKKQVEEERQKIKAEKQKIKNRSKRKKKKLRKQQKAEEEKMALFEANTVEDREIKTCEKLLRLNKRKSKTISLGFKNDGLDFLLEAVDPEYLKNLYEHGDDVDDPDVLVDRDPDSAGSDQSDVSGDSGDEEEELSDQDVDISSDENEEEVTLLKPTSVKGILKHSITAENDQNTSEKESLSKNCGKAKETKKKQIIFEKDLVNSGDISEDVLDKVIDGEVKEKGVKHKREREVVNKGETDETVVERKRPKKDKLAKKCTVFDNDKSGEERRDLCIIKNKTGENVDKNTCGVNVEETSQKTRKSGKKDRSLGEEKAKSGKHKDTVDAKTKYKGKKEKKEASQDCVIMETLLEDSEDDPSPVLGTQVLEQVKGQKEPLLDDSMDYLYGVEDSISDTMESSDFPSSAMENSMTLSSSEEEGEENEDLDNVVMETDSSEDSEEESRELEDEEGSDLEEEEGNLESGPELTEDIYGRLRDKHGKVVEKTTGTLRGTERGTGAYVPPAKRLEPLSDKKKAEMERMRKQLKGLLNRVSESNMQSIANQIEELFRSHSRAETSEALTDLIMGSCVATYMVPERLVMEQCMLLAILHHNIGSEVGGTFLQSVAKQFKDYYDNPGESKEIHNVVTVLANLFNFKVVHSLLIFDVLKKFTERFEESDIEVILVILKAVGFTLRKEDPGSLKEFIVNVQSVAASVNTEKFTDKSRVQFMLDVILHLKNNNMRKIPNYDPSHLEHLRKVIRQRIRGGSYGDSQLRISLADLLEAQDRGKWWLVGSAWSGRIESHHEAKPNETDASQQVTVPGVSQKLLDLAHKQRMNTEVRRNIFCVIMTAEDFVDCFEKLLRLGLKHQQEREIIHVIVDLCVQEKAFNPFYAFLSQKFCEYHRRFQMTLQFHMWDRFKELSTLSKVKLDHLSKLLSHLLATGALSLSVFKVLEFAELDKHNMTLVKSILTSLLLDYDIEVTQKVFLRIASLTKLETLKEGLSVFMKHFICRNRKPKDGEKQTNIDLQLLRERVDVADKCLNTKNQVKM